MTDSVRIRVWDPLIRVIHWSLVVGVASNIWLTEAGGDIHQWIGYGIAGLISLRILWGFIGPWSARWTSFWPTPRRLKQYVFGSSVIGKTGIGKTGIGNTDRITHTPLGAVMMLVLMTLLIGLGVTGYMMEETTRFWGVDWVEETHETMANALLFLVPLHVLGAIVESIKKRDNLIGSMLHGYRHPEPSSRGTPEGDEK